MLSIGLLVVHETRAGTQFPTSFLAFLKRRAAFKRLMFHR